MGSYYDRDDLLISYNEAVDEPTRALIRLYKTKIPQYFGREVSVFKQNSSHLILRGGDRFLGLSFDYESHFFIHTLV